MVHRESLDWIDGYLDQPRKKGELAQTGHGDEAHEYSLAIVLLSMKLSLE